ncbi:MAG: excisionase family DNA-binding protein [Deltaproteobacteria bacterium]|nr:excisionase family DNA-binding protein [Deltaproteobacteria bacterium]
MPTVAQRPKARSYAGRGSKTRIAVTTGEAARYCLVTADSIVNWISAGLLPAQRTAGGQYRIRIDDLRSFMTSRGMRTDLLELEIGKPPTCWEFWSSISPHPISAETAPGCIDCPVYRSRASVCYEVRPLLPGGTVRALECCDCEYLAILFDTTR